MEVAPARLVLGLCFLNTDTPDTQGLDLVFPFAGKTRHAAQTSDTRNSSDDVSAIALAKAEALGRFRRRGEAESS